MEYIKENYLKCSGTGSSWTVDIEAPKRKVRSYFEETIEAIEHLYENKTGKFTLLLSGGVDSHYLGDVLQYLKMDFNTIIINFNNNQGKNYNEHDTKWAHEFCESRNIQPTILDINFDKLVESGKGVEVAESVQCFAPAIAYRLAILDQIDGFILMANDPPYLRYEKDKDFFGLLVEEYDRGLIRFAEKFNLNGCPSVLTYTSEMLLSFLLDPAIKKLGTGLMPGKLGSNSTKSHVFNNGSNFNLPVYDFTKKIRIKLHGFENIYSSPIGQHPNIRILIDYYSQIWNGEYIAPYSDIVKKLSLHQ
jgi:hypothetical protein